MTIVHTPCMTSTRIAVATLSAAVLSSAAALTMGAHIGDTIRGTEDVTPTSTTTTYELPTTTTTYGPDHVDCQPFVLADGVDYSHLTDAGWFGLPTDGMEALYAPECAGSI